ncbi:MAG: sugar phosphate isomerase/epimerase family protein [Planctomycetia bacterium]|nr:sugar phosphate isomerase/epimerase family protein [Planctomycetia bacterium]
MKIAMCNEMFNNWPFADQFRFIRECGYDGVEIAPFSIANDLNFADPPTSDVRMIDRNTRKELVRIAEGEGIQISGLHWLFAHTDGNYYLTSPDPEIQAKTADYFKELVRFCREIGGSYLVVGSPRQRSVPANLAMSAAYDSAARIIQAVLPVLEETGVILALEPLTAQETNFLLTADDALFLVEKLGRPKNLGIHLDCKAMFGSERAAIPEVIRNSKYTPFLHTFHANDPNLRGPGFGDLDFQTILQALDAVHFDGWIGVEPFDYTASIERLAKESIRNLKKFLPKSKWER